MAAIGLGEMASTEAVAPLVRVLQSGDTQARRAAAWALAQIPSRQAGAVLDRAASDEDPEVRLWCTFSRL